MKRGINLWIITVFILGIATAQTALAYEQLPGFFNKWVDYIEAITLAKQGAHYSTKYDTREDKKLKRRLRGYEAKFAAKFSEEATPYIISERAKALRHMYEDAEQYRDSPYQEGYLYLIYSLSQLLLPEESPLKSAQMIAIIQAQVTEKISAEFKTNGVTIMDLLDPLAASKHLKARKPAIAIVYDGIIWADKEEFVESCNTFYYRILQAQEHGGGATSSIALNLATRRQDYDTKIVILYNDWKRSSKEMQIKLYNEVFDIYDHLGDLYSYSEEAILLLDELRLWGEQEHIIRKEKKVSLNLIIDNPTGDDWLMFHKNPEHTGFVNMHVNPPLKLRWEHTGTKSIFSSPIVVDGTVYYGGMDSYFYALDSASGRQKWKQMANGNILASAAADRRHLYFATEKGSIYCLSLKYGHQTWMRTVGGAVFSSPIIKDGRIYFTSYDNFLYALDAKTGGTIWKVSMNAPSISSPTISGDLLFVGSGDARIYAVNLKTGEIKWSLNTGGEVNCAPSVLGDAVYFGSNNGKIYALAQKDGQILWTKQTGSSIRASLVVVKDTVYAGSMDGYLYALDAKTGYEKWKSYCYGPISSSPVAINGFIYVGAENGGIYCYELASGDEKWRYITKGKIKSSPVALDGLLYVGSYDNSMYAFETSGNFY